MKRFYTFSIIITFAIIGAIVFVNIGGNTIYHMGAFELKMGVQFKAPGGTEIVLPPIGKIEALTHKLPLRAELTLQNINLDLLKEIIYNFPGKEEFIKNFALTTRKNLNFFVFKLLALSFAGGAFGVWVAGRRKWQNVLSGALIGIVFTGTSLFGLGYTYDLRAFNSPKFEGILEAAPWMIGVAKDSLDRVDELKGQMQVMAVNLYKLFSKVDQLGELDKKADEIRILHVSDIHNNPLGMSMVKQITQGFKPDFIVDTGDITDFGTPLEAELLTKVQELGVPYVYVPGNHDTSVIIEKLKHLKNVKVLESGVTEVDGVNIIGLSDPAAYSANVEPPTREEAKKSVAKIEEFVRAAKEKGKTPFIIAVHNNRIARKLVGEAPVILYGHDHAVKVQEIKGSAFLDAGTTGAAGLRMLQADKGAPYSVILLRISKSKPHRLLATDTILVKGEQDGFTVQRRVFTKPIENDIPVYNPAKL